MVIFIETRSKNVVARGWGRWVKQRSKKYKKYPVPKKWSEELWNNNLIRGILNLTL